MTTLIEARKSNGTLIGRCDARCHNATHPRCTCICGGRNHGIGGRKAWRNTQVEFAEIEKEISELGGEIRSQTTLFF